jgi:putative ATPase
VPLHLRNAPTKLMRGLGYGRGYQYAHDYEGATIAQQHLPDALRERRYYLPESEAPKGKSEELRGSKKIRAKGGMKEK